MSAPATIPGVIVIVPDHRPSQPAWLCTWRDANGTPFGIRAKTPEDVLVCVGEALRDHGHPVSPLVATARPEPPPPRREGRPLTPPTPPALTPAQQDARRVAIVCGRR